MSRTQRSEQVSAEGRNGGGSAGRGLPSASYTGRASGWNDLAEQLSELARTLQNHKDVDSTLDAIVRAATDTVLRAR